MKSLAAVRLLFVVAALYDGLLGLAFLLRAKDIFVWFEVTEPNHYGYVHFAACLLITFAIMFLAVAWSPVKNRGLIPYGILLKVSYCGVAFYHWFSAGIPNLWKPFAFIDLAFIFLFVSALVYLVRQRQ